MAISLRPSRSLLLAGSLVFCLGTAFAGDVHRAIVTRVAPVYPEIARRMRISGKVVLLVSIAPDGTVSGTKVQSGHALLTVAAQDAVRRWHFAPNADSSESEVEVNFSIDNN